MQKVAIEWNEQAKILARTQARVEIIKQIRADIERDKARLAYLDGLEKYRLEDLEFDLYE